MMVIRAPFLTWSAISVASRISSEVNPAAAVCPKKCSKQGTQFAATAAPRLTKTFDLSSMPEAPFPKRLSIRRKRGLKGYRPQHARFKNFLSISTGGKGQEKNIG
jgi:hypothetical protein